MEGLMKMVGGDMFTILIILIIIIVAIWTYITKRDKDILTMIGIFGTFSGIISGLYFFDKDDIDGSIPLLIDGLKTAFYTSIAGLFATIVLSLLDKNDDSKDETDFLKDIKNVIENGNSQNNLILQELKALNKGIGGDSDNSLVNQIKLLKSDGNENHRELKKSFDAFADKMADNNIDALTEAIEKVMGEFNTIINEKLGKTFDDFKTSVENLNIWQSEYKQNIIDSTESLNLSKESLEKSSKGFEITVEKSEVFNGVSEKLGDELKSLNDSLAIFKNGINEFDGMSGKFDGVVKNTKEMADSMSESINSLTDNFVSKAETMVGESEKQITLMKNVFAEQSKDLTDSHKNILDDLKSNVDNTNKNVSEQFERIGNELEKQVVKLDNELGDALDKSLSSLGQELTSITNKFTQQLADLNNVINNVNK